MTAPPVAATPSRALLEHARSRAPVVGGALVLAAVGALASSACPERSAAGVAAALSNATGGFVQPDDYVWEPSGGFWADALVGRPVLFLSSAGPGLQRDLYRARVTVTRQGRAMKVRGVARLTATSLADEDALVASGSRVAVESRAAGKVQGVAFIDAEPPAVLRGLVDGTAGLGRAAVSYLSFARPPERVAFEIQNQDLVLQIGGDPLVLDAHHGLVGVSKTAGAYAVGPFEITPEPRPRTWASSILGGIVLGRPAAPPPLAPTSPVRFHSGDGATSFPPSPAFSVGLGSDSAQEAAILAGRAGEARLYAFDMRQLELEIVVGREIPASETGHRASGQKSDPREPLAVLSVPTSGGAVDRGVLVAPLSSSAAVLSDGKMPSLLTGLPPGGSSTAISFSILDPEAASPPGVLCITGSGHLVFGWEPAAQKQWWTSAFDGIDCVVMLPLQNPERQGLWVREGEGAAMAATDPAMPLQWQATNDTSSIVFYRKEQRSDLVGIRGSKWELDSNGQPDPSFAPAIEKLQIDELGAPVVVHRFAKNRFEWVIRGGEREKSHRMGGTFEKALSPADLDRAYFSTGLAVGKRKNPLGLRISGSTGHKFHGTGALFEAGTQPPSIGPSSEREIVGDATELPLTVHGGVVVAAARERGPLQARSDMCVTPDGTVLYAEATFDSHEATATALLELGCGEAAALDRGAESAAWTEWHGSIAPLHEGTSVTALALPMRGSIVVR